MGPLSGLKIIELVGLGPGPFVGMLLADLGAEVIAVDRMGNSEAPQLAVDIHRRGKKSIVLDLKSATGKEVFFKLCQESAAVFEGFRPGVVEKLGIGPEACLEKNPSLVYGRMTGWGQTGPLAKSAGHDINYIALTGALHAMGFKNSVPTPPLNLIGDYAGGMFLALGLVSAILYAKNTGEGQVIDAAMVDGVNILMTLFHSFYASHMWGPERESNLLDGGAHFYRCYRTKDDKFISLGAIEKPFMKLFIEKAELSSDLIQAHNNPAQWPESSQELEQVFAARTQQQWCDLLENTDACFAPVIPFWEAPNHFHNIEREAFLTANDVVQPTPAPRFSKTQLDTNGIPVNAGADSEHILSELGYSEADIKKIIVDQTAYTSRG